MPATVSDPAPASVAPSLFTSGEKLFSPAAIAKLIPSHRDAAHVNSATVFRWITRGVKTTAGAVVKLEAVKLGTFWRTSLEAVERFGARLTAAAMPSDDPSATPTPTPKQHKTAAARATREADAIFGAAKSGK